MSVEEQGRHEFTRILRECREGDGDALERLMPLVYDELRRVANHYMQNERSGHTLQPTALVHEAYARLVGAEIEWESRVHFFRAAGRGMRRVLVDHARARGSAKRGGERVRVTLDDGNLRPKEAALDIVELDDALERLARDRRKSSSSSSSSASAVRRSLERSTSRRRPSTAIRASPAPGCTALFPRDELRSGKPAQVDLRRR